jgi:glycosyltransferase involved in cell wall biosynthesis
MVGRIARWKGQHIFVEMIPEVVKQVPEARFVVVGAAASGREARYERDVRARAQALRLDDLLQFCGPRRDIPQVMAALDVLVLPSVDPEPMGRVVIEAMSCGKPVVATDHGGPAEIVDEGVTGVLVPPSNVDALAFAVTRLLKNASLREALGRRARKKAVERFSLSKHVGAITRIYGELVPAIQGDLGS